MKKIVVSLLWVGFSVTLFAQEGPATLSEQYQELRSENKIIENYRMIEIYKTDRFWNAVKDTLAVNATMIQEERQKVAALNDEISKLNQVIASKDEVIDSQEFDREHIQVAGIDLTKTFYVSFTSIVFVLLALGIVTLIFINKANLQRKREATELYESVYAEFETYKHNALEKQMKLSRELLDQRHKLEKLNLPQSHK